MSPRVFRGQRGVGSVVPLAFDSSQRMCAHRLPRLTGCEIPISPTSYGKREAGENVSSRVTGNLLIFISPNLHIPH